MQQFAYQLKLVTGLEASDAGLTGLEQTTL